MKIGDLVKYGSWYTGTGRDVGLVLDIDLGNYDVHGANGDYWVLVLWGNNVRDWEEGSVIELVA